MSAEQHAALEGMARFVEADAYLGGGVAVALRIEHRRSVEFRRAASPSTGEPTSSAVAGRSEAF